MISITSFSKNSSCLEAALDYLKQGFSVIPIGANKKPLILWKQFQKRYPLEAEMRDWFNSFAKANVGIVTGKISNLVVVDIEKGGSLEGLTPTAIVETGGGGYHYYYKHPGFEIKNDSKQLGDLVDIRGDGGFVIAPPSLHKSGKRYKWKEGYELS